MGWLEEKTTWTTTDYINYYDFNVIENNCKAVADAMEEYGGTPPTLVSLNMERTMYSVDYWDTLDRIEGNILLLKNALYEPPDWLTPKTTWNVTRTFPTITDVNRMESNLLGLYTIARNIYDGLKQCGAYTCGEGGTIL